MVTWTHKNHDVKTVYLVEYIDNKEIYERFNQTGDFDLAKKETFTGDVGEALLFYFARMYDERTYWYKMYEEIIVDGETVREAGIEPETRFKRSMRQWIEGETAKQLDEAERRVNELEKEREVSVRFVDAVKRNINSKLELQYRALYNSIHEEVYGW